MNKKLDDSKWELVFSGKRSCKFDNFGFSMMVGRLSRKFRKSPNTLASCIEEANSFCDKYGPILESDLERLNNV